MIKKDKQYQTKWGYKVEIYRTNGVNGGNIIGAYLTDEGWEISEWNQEGTWLPGGSDTPSNMDLIEAPMYLAKDEVFKALERRWTLPIRKKGYENIGIKIYGFEPEIMRESEEGDFFVVFKAKKNY